MYYRFACTCECVQASLEMKFLQRPLILMSPEHTSLHVCISYICPSMWMYEHHREGAEQLSVRSSRHDTWGRRILKEIATLLSFKTRITQGVKTFLVSHVREEIKFMTDHLFHANSHLFLQLFQIFIAKHLQPPKQGHKNGFTIRSIRERVMHNGFTRP